MKIIEVRDGFVKIESEKKIEISSFLELKGTDKKYVAQVIRSKTNGTGYNVYAKILFINDGSLKKYDKTMPDNLAEISEFSFETINNSFNYARPVVAGKFASNGNNILIDSESFGHLTMASIDNSEMNNIVVQNLAKQFKQFGKTVIIDMLGVVNADKFVAGRDFKLPLNTESLKFMYEDCLNDATADSKNMIKEIFTDLAEYSRDVKFLPFITLKTIVDDMVEKSHIFKLLVFKNKLAKFDSAGYFASYPADAENLSKILKSDFSIIDLSKVDSLFQNRYLSVILSELNEISPQTSVLIEASNAINKKNIKTLLYTESLKTIFVTHSKFKYLQDLKPLFKNYLLENTYANKNVFNLYSFFLESMDESKYLIVGEGTNYVPLISNVEKYDIQIQKLPQDAISEEVIDTAYNEEVADISTDEKVPEGIDEPAELLTVIDEDEAAELREADDNGLSDAMILEEDNQDIVQTEEIDEESETTEIENSQEISDDETVNIENEENLTEENPSTEDFENQGIFESDESENIEDKTEPEIIENEENSEGSISETENTDTQSEEDDVEIPKDLADDFEEIEQQTLLENTETDENGLQEEIEEYDELKIIPLDNQEDELGEFKELDELEEADINANDIMVNIDDSEDNQESDENTLNNEFYENISVKNLDQDIVEDVDKVFTTMKDDSISDADLDFIDALNESGSEADLSEEEMFSENDNETLEQLSDDEEEGFLEPLEEVSDSTQSEPEREILEKRDSSTPIVPIYDADIPDEDKVVSDAIEQGDTVFHAKYGSGVVEKMIKYGNKNLFSINFDNVGRRLLDPTLTEIKKA